MEMALAFVDSGLTVLDVSFNREIGGLLVPCVRSISTFRQSRSIRLAYDHAGQQYCQVDQTETLPRERHKRALRSTSIPEGFCACNYHSVAPAERCVVATSQNTSQTLQNLTHPPLDFTDVVQPSSSKLHAKTPSFVFFVCLSPLSMSSFYIRRRRLGVSQPQPLLNWGRGSTHDSRLPHARTGVRRHCISSLPLSDNDGA